MSYKIRNTIVLAAILVLLTGAGGYYTWFHQPGQIDELKKSIARIEKELVNLPTLIREVEDLTYQFQDIRRKYDSRSKEIPQTDISSQTYAYISRGIDEAGFLKFSFQFDGSRNFSNYGYNVYTLSDGEANFENLYKFIYFLENGRRLYKINWLNLDEREQVDPETKETKKWLTFSMELHAYYSKIQELGQSLAATALTTTQVPFDPFNPIILQAVATDAPVGEIDPNKVDVKAILPGKAFVLHGGELIVLHLGDRVWRGHVSRISPTENKVEFTVNEGGIVRKIERRILFETEKRKR